MSHPTRPFALPNRPRARWSPDPRVVTAVAAIVCVVLAIGLALAALSGREADPAATLDPGDRLALTHTPYLDHTRVLTVPGTKVTARIGRPVTSFDAAFVELGSAYRPDRGPVTAGDGGRLVPVAWSVQASDLPAVQDLQGVQHTDIEINLVAGGSRVAIASGTFESLISPRGEDLRSALVGIPDTDPGEVRLEVSFDGATQSLSASGVVDQRAVEGLSSPTVISTSCVSLVDMCQLTATDPRAPWRPRRANAPVQIAPITLHPYDSELGWAGAGKRWATVEVSAARPNHLVDKDGEYRDVEEIGDTEVTLDGSEPKRTVGLRAGRTNASTQGTVVFEVDAHTTPEELTVKRRLHLEGDASPRAVDTATTLRLG